MSNRPIAVSLKGRGLAVFDRPPGQGGLKRLWHHVAAETVDLGVAIATNVVLLAWSTWFSVILTILSLCFYAFFQDGSVARDGSMLIPLAFLVYLPTLMLAYSTNNRRLQAAQQLEAVQSHVVGMYILHAGMASCGAPHLLVELDDAISDTMVQLQGYLAHPRPLSSRHISPSILRAENLPKNSRLFVLGRDIGQRLRRLQSCMRRLAAAASALLHHCSSNGRGQYCSQQAVALLQLVVQLSSAITALCSLKELRSPLLLRVMLRSGCVLLSPLLSGSWLAWLAGQPPGATGMVFALVVGAIIQVLLMSLLTLTLLFEDPFDTGPAAAPDTVSLLEFNHTLSYLTAPPSTDEEPPETAAVEVEQQHQQQDEQTKTRQQIQGFILQQQQRQASQTLDSPTGHVVAAAAAAVAPAPRDEHVTEYGAVAVAHSSSQPPFAQQGSAAVSMPGAVQSDAAAANNVNIAGGTAGVSNTTQVGPSRQRASPTLTGAATVLTAEREHCQQELCQERSASGLQEVCVAVE